MIHQLRIYEINPAKREVFHARFKQHAMRIMKTYGFHVVAIWESTDQARLDFMYLLEWQDEQTLERQWKKFMADQEWIDIKKDTVASGGEPVLHVTSRVLSLVDYSPKPQ